jgi:hypothetical protein
VEGDLRDLGAEFALDRSPDLCRHLVVAVWA